MRNKLLIQISGGRGPAECSIAVEKLCKELLREYKNSSVVFVNEDNSGNGYKSAIMEIDDSVNDLTGTVLWICKSPVRANHQRKNWYVDVSILNEAEEITDFKEEDCKIETMHCGGKGGQNVNKVESGVRVRHIASGITVECRQERSQYMNKQKALKRIQAILRKKEEDNKKELASDAWSKHSEIVRGNPVRVYEGEKFKRKNIKM